MWAYINHHALQPFINKWVNNYMNNEWVHSLLCFFQPQQMGSLNPALFSRRLNAEESMPRLQWLSSSNLFANSVLLLGNKPIIKIPCWEMKWCWPGSFWLSWLPPTEKDSSQRLTETLAWDKGKSHWDSGTQKKPEAYPLKIAYLPGLLCSKLLPLATLAWMKAQFKKKKKWL